MRATQVGPAVVILSFVSIAAGVPVVDLETVAVSGTQAPGTAAGVTFRNAFSVPIVDSTGRVCFRNQLAGPGVTSANDVGIWVGEPGRLALVAREGDPAPGAAGASYNVISAPLFTEGVVVFTATLTGAGVTSANNQGLFVGTADSIRLVARTGNTPNSALGLRLALINDPVVNERGSVAFRALVQGPDVNFMNDTCVYSVEAGAPRLILREGTPMPQFGPNAAIGDLASGPISINAAGQVQAVTSLSGAGSGTRNLLWRGTPDGITPLAWSFRQAWGCSQGQLFLDIFNPVAHCADGTTAYGANLQGPGTNPYNSNGLWIGEGVSMSLLARTGQPAPGTTAEVQSFTSPLHLNSARDVAFAATLSGPGVTPDNMTGLWRGRLGKLRLLARGGDPAPGMPEGVRFAGHFVGRLALNDSGSMVFQWVLTGPGVDASNDAVTYFADAEDRLFPVLREGQLVRLGPGDVRTLSACYLFAGGPSAGADGRGTSLGAGGHISMLAAFPAGAGAALLAKVRCTADFNGDGRVDFFDFLEFVDLFNNNDPRADYNGDGEVDFFDFLDFTTDFDAGC